MLDDIHLSSHAESSLLSTEGNLHATTTTTYTTLTVKASSRMANLMKHWGPVRGAFVVTSSHGATETQCASTEPHRLMIPFISRLNSPLTLRDVEAPVLHEELALAHYLRENRARVLVPWKGGGRLRGWVLIDVEEEGSENLDEIAAALALLHPGEDHTGTAPEAPSSRPEKRLVAWIDVNRFGLVTGRSPFGRAFTRGSRLGYPYQSLRSPTSKDCLYRGLKGEQTGPATYQPGSNYEVAVHQGQTGVRLLIEQPEKAERPIAPSITRSISETCAIAEAWRRASALCAAHNGGVLPRLTFIGGTIAQRIRLSHEDCAAVLANVWQSLLHIPTPVNIATARVQAFVHSPKYLALDIDVEWSKPLSSSSSDDAPPAPLPGAINGFHPHVRVHKLYSRLGLRLQIHLPCAKTRPVKSTLPAKVNGHVVLSPILA